METPQHFIQTHQAKLAWKYFKHGVGVAFGTEKREGRTTKHETSATEDSQYIELIYG